MVGWELNQGGGGINRKDPPQILDMSRESETSSEILLFSTLTRTFTGSSLYLRTDFAHFYQEEIQKLEFFGAPKLFCNDTD